jgi:pimeloyl-ACP methyl ester carboxylesterase
VGLSNGGAQAATFAMERPGRVERVATLAPAALYQRISASWWRATVPVMFLGGRERCERYWATYSVARDRSALQQAHAELMVRFFVGMRAAYRDAYPRTYKADRLSRMAMPVLAVFGRQDILYDSTVAAAKARAALPHAQVEVLDDCGHMINFDQPAALAELLGKFLAAGVSGAGPDSAM